MTTQQQVSNNLIWAILATICCCWPLGIPAIVFAARVNGLLEQGDYNGAVENANKAKRFAMYAAIAAAVVWILVIVFYVLVFGLALLSSSSS